MHRPGWLLQLQDNHQRLGIDVRQVWKVQGSQERRLFGLGVIGMNSITLKQLEATGKTYEFKRYGCGDDAVILIKEVNYAQ